MNSRTPRSFTPDQERAISAEDREVLVVAPAGSGKTEVLIQRVIRTLENTAGEAFRLLVVTFTVKAAEELKQRARENIAEELWRVDADTIHGFALDWLKRYGMEFGIGPDVIVLSDDVDRLAVIAEYLQSIGFSSDDTHDAAGMKDLLEAIDAHRTQHDGQRCQCCDNYTYFGVSLEELADAYGAALRAQGAIDFPGMLLGLSELLNEDKWVLDHFRTLYRYILVDEGQDLTAIQSALLRQLAGDSISLFVVADDKQSIRGYAGGAFSHAEALVPSAAYAPLHLDHNFRCAKEILRTAEAVLRTTAGEREALSIENAPPGTVSFLPMATPEDEADWTASWITKLLSSGLRRDTIMEGEDPVVDPEDIAVAARTRWSLAPVIAALTRRDIPFVVQTEAGALLPEPEARLFVDCLAFGVNKKDLPSARRANDELYELTGSEFNGDPLQRLRKVENEALKSVADLVTRSLQDRDEFERAMEEVVAAGNSHDWSEGARTLSEIWRDYQTSTNLQGRSPQGFLAYLAKIQRTRPTDPGVRLLTIDRAKGLEFKAVALVGVRNGLIPHYRAKSPHERNEECRRLYVAMTRAARELVVTWPTTTVDRYGRTHGQNPSPFLVEADLLDTQSRMEEPPATQKELW